MPEFDSPEGRAEFRAESRRLLLEAGVPESAVDGLLDMASEYGKQAAEAVEEFEWNGAKVIYGELNSETFQWEHEDQFVRDNYRRAFAAAVDFIDEETYDPDSE